MKFSGNLIITDPVLIFKEPHEEWWEKTEYCKKMSVLGLQDNYILSEPSYPYMDSLIVNTHSENPDKVLIDYLKTDSVSLREGDEPFSDFSTESGIIGVFVVSDIKEHYNPDIEKILDDHLGEIGFVPDFTGDIRFFNSKETKSFHIIGEGNYNFYTVLK